MIRLLKKTLLPALCLMLIFTMMPAVSAAEITASGNCGSNATYTLYSNGHLVIDGKGTTTGNNDILYLNSKVTSIMINDGITSIGDRLFLGYSNLKEISIPSSVKRIGVSAFHDSGLESITIPEGVVTIDSYAFSDCELLNEINLPHSLRMMSSEVFNSCPSLETITLPEGVIELGMNVFRNCSLLQSIVFPLSVKKIGWDCFEGCYLLSDVYYAGNETQWNQIEFSRNHNAPLFEATIHFLFGHEHNWRESGQHGEGKCLGYYQQYTCTLCGETKEQFVQGNNEHQWNSGEITKEATCAKQGTLTYTCELCGNTKTEAIPKTTDHKWDAGTVTKAATTASKGTRTFVCTVCGKEKTENIPQKEKPAVFVPGDVNLNGKVESADARLALRASVKLESYPEKSYEFFAADADLDKTISSADARLILRASVKLETLTAPHVEHMWDDGVVTKKATCTAKGQMLYTCTVCGETKTKETNKTAHTEVKDPAVAATCQKEGKTAGSHCSVCGTIIKEQEATPKTDHKWDKGTVSGNIITYTCTVCGQKKTENQLKQRFAEWIKQNGETAGNTSAYNIIADDTAADDGNSTLKVTARYSPSEKQYPFSLIISVCLYDQSVDSSIDTSVTLQIDESLHQYLGIINHSMFGLSVSGSAEIRPSTYQVQNNNLKITYQDKSGLLPGTEEVIPELLETSITSSLLTLQEAFDNTNADLDIGRDFGFVNIKKAYDEQNSGQQDTPEPTPVTPEPTPVTPEPADDAFRSVSGALDGYNKMARYIFDNGIKQSDGIYLYQASTYTTLTFNNNTGAIVLTGRNSSFTDRCSIVLSPTGGTAYVEGKTKADAASGYIYANFTGTLTTSAYNGKTGSGSGYRNDSVSYSSSGIGQYYALSATELATMETVSGLYYAARDMGISMRELGFLSY